jgi:hypothetical protein
MPVPQKYVHGRQCGLALILKRQIQRLLGNVILNLKVQFVLPVFEGFDNLLAIALFMKTANINIIVQFHGLVPNQVQDIPKTQEPFLAHLHEDIVNNPYGFGRRLFVHYPPFFLPWCAPLIFPSFILA